MILTNMSLHDYQKNPHHFQVRTVDPTGI